MSVRERGATGAARVDSRDGTADAPTTVLVAEVDGHRCGLPVETVVDPMGEVDSKTSARFQDLSALLAAAPDAMLIADKTGHIVELNERCARMVGYNRADLVGQSVDLLVPVAMRDLHRRQRTTSGTRPIVREMGSGVDLVAVRKDRTQIPVDISLAPFETDRGALVLASLRDVTRSRHDERLFRSFIDAAPDAVVIVDSQGQITLVNARTLEMLGYERCELVGQSVVMLMPARLASLYGSYLADYIADPPPGPVIGLSGGLFVRRKDGTEVPVEISLAQLGTDDGSLFLADVRDVTERTEIFAAMREAEEREQVLAATNRAKDAFLATVSHELRTPLASILGFAELMAEGGKLTPECEHFLSVIIRNGRRELRLVNDLLALVTIADDGLEIHTASADLVSLVRDAVENAEVQAAEAGVTLRAVLPDHTVAVRCDAERISQVLDIVLSNALKFTPSGGEVNLRLYADGSTAYVEVADTGIGIGDSEPGRVFERLYRSQTAIANAIPGAGIGLSIASAIVSAHRGSIRVLSTDNPGSTFQIQLPLQGHPDVHAVA